MSDENPVPEDVLEYHRELSKRLRLENALVTHRHDIFALQFRAIAKQYEVQSRDAQIAIFALSEALGRILLAFQNLLAGKPVRDADETIAEAQAALQSLQPK